MCVCVWRLVPLMAGFFAICRVVWGGLIHAPRPSVTPLSSTWTLMAIPIAACLAVACGSGESPLDSDSYAAVNTSVGESSNSSAQSPAVDSDAAYRGPSVGAAKGFAALAETSVSALNQSPVTGNLGVSGAPVRSITGFDDVPVLKFGTDSSAPNSLRTILTQREVDALVDNIDVRACDADYADLAELGTERITIRPGVTCFNTTNADLRLNGLVTFDAGGDPNAFFVIRSNSALTVADSTRVVLANGAQPCAVFWHVAGQANIGKGVELLGTVIAGTSITMQSGSTLIGRALARTGGVILDGTTITLPVYDSVVSNLTCTHLQ